MFVIFGLWEMNFFKEVSTLFVIDVALLITSWHRCYVRVMKFYMEGFIGLLCLDYVGSPLFCLSVLSGRICYSLVVSFVLLTPLFYQRNFFHSDYFVVSDFNFFTQVKIVKLYAYNFKTFASAGTSWGFVLMGLIVDIGMQNLLDLHLLLRRSFKRSNIYIPTIITHPTSFSNKEVLVIINKLKNPCFLKEIILQTKG